MLRYAGSLGLNLYDKLHALSPNKGCIAIRHIPVVSLLHCYSSALPFFCIASSQMACISDISGHQCLLCVSRLSNHMSVRIRICWACRQSHHVSAHWHDRRLCAGSGHATGTGCRCQGDQADLGRSESSVQTRNWPLAILTQGTCLDVPAL